MTTTEKKIKKSSAGIQTKIIIGGIILLILAITITLIFKYLIGMGTRIENIIIYLLWISLLIFWTIWVIIEHRNITNISYLITADSLITVKKSWFGISKKYYRYNNIKAVTTKENHLLSSLNTGSICLEFVDNTEKLILKNIVNPSKYVAEIKKYATLNKTIIK